MRDFRLHDVFCSDTQKLAQTMCDTTALQKSASQLQRRGKITALLESMLCFLVPAGGKQCPFVYQCLIKIVKKNKLFSFPSLCCFFFQISHNNNLLSYTGLHCGFEEITLETDAEESSKINKNLVQNMKLKWYFSVDNKPSAKNK